MFLNHSLAWSLLILTPVAIWRTRWSFTLLGPMLWFSLFSGWAFLHSAWDVVYHPLTIGWTLTCQSLAVAESCWLLARQERSRVEAALVICFALLVGVALALTFAASNPQPYGNWSPALFYTRTSVHILLVGSLGSVTGYHFAKSGKWCPAAAHASILFAYLGANIASHALKDPAKWLNRNALQLGVHVACVIAWIWLGGQKGHKPSFETT